MSGDPGRSSNYQGSFATVPLQSLYLSVVTTLEMGSVAD